MRQIRCAFTFVAAFLLFSSVAVAQDLKPIGLPQPQMTGGKPLMEALRDR